MECLYTTSLQNVIDFLLRPLYELVETPCTAAASAHLHEHLHEAVHRELLLVLQARALHHLHEELQPAQHHLRAAGSCRGSRRARWFRAS